MFTCALSIAGTKKHPKNHPDVLEYKVGRRAGQEVWQLHDVAKDKAILHQKAQEQIDLGRRTMTLDTLTCR